MSQKSLFVIPECYIDTALVEYVLDMHVNHQHSCNNVVRTMKERYGDGLLWGLLIMTNMVWGILMNVLSLQNQSILKCLSTKTEVILLLQ